MKFNNWRKSSRSANNQACIYVATDGDRVAIKESDDTSGTITLTDREKFRVFVEGVKAGEFDDMI